MLTDTEKRQKQFAENRENLLRNVLNREKEIIEKVKLWREEVMKKINNLADTQSKYLEKDMTLTSALLQFKDSDLNFKKDHNRVQVIFMNHGIKENSQKKRKTETGLTISA